METDSEMANVNANSSLQCQRLEGLREILACILSAIIFLLKLAISS